MKNSLIVILILAFIYVACSDSKMGTEPEKTTVMMPANESLLSDSVKAIFIQDGYRLALEKLLAADPKNVNVIEIPDNDFKDFYYGLIHVYNTISPQRDSIFELYHVRSAPDPVFKEFIVITDSSNTWANKWIKNIYPTGYAKLDSLIRKYSLEIMSYDKSQDEILLLIKSNKYNNIQALCNVFKKLEGIEKSSPNYRGNYDNYWSVDIKALKFSSSILYEFIYINDDFHREGLWYYEVKYDGNVVYLGKNIFK